MAQLKPLFVGIDVGTEGVRAVAASASGEIVGSVSVPHEQPKFQLPDGWFEQDASLWWETTKLALATLCKRVDVCDIVALSVTSTSGTFVPVDKSGKPLRNALMYSDMRAIEEADEVRQCAHELEAKLGYRIQPSFALPKMLWLKKHEPHIFEMCAKLLHAADFIVSKLTGIVGVSDFSNALKTCFDLVEMRFPEWIESALGIPIDKLPKVVAPGDEIGFVSSDVAEEIGMPTSIVVVAGATDGTAAFICSGAKCIGEWNSNLGSTLVLRGLCKRIIPDERGRIYYHRHPDGFWLSGAASSTGGECLRVRFPNKDLAAMDEMALRCIPTKLLIYPLVRRGERFPFVNGHAEGFVVGEPKDEAELYAAHIEGVAFVERWCFEVFEQVGHDICGTVFITGGGSKSKLWNIVRSSVLRRALVRPKTIEAAFGAAIIAASRKWFSSLSEAASIMVQLEETIEPCEGLSKAYEDAYMRFREECERRGYE
ncbi:MAG: FGGY-family carbohydrate kinase [Armatimonadota bacterium]|nr:FGGY-family carbohydrate kinase [Armatimonadota bacterium]MCX7777401.1 FGGY-family carbohydrate kinase [Armatimonadota bacterium]MDW8025070.1 FGGY-family carbohydrate kinase [Armatimonadota bacterium]